MKTGALVLGIIGGLVVLLYGFFGFGLGSFANSGKEGSGTLLMLLAIVFPVIALIGAGIVKAKPIIGAGLMAFAALGFLLIIGFNCFSFIPVVLLGLGALLGFLGSQEDKKESPESS